MATSGPLEPHPEKQEAATAPPAISAEILVSLIAEGKWLFHEAIQAFSWSGIGWFVALFLGVWGAMISIGAFIPAYIFLGLSLVLCALKWGHVTCLHNKNRKVFAFIAGQIVLVLIALAILRWTHGRAVQAGEDAAKLAPLSRIPALEKQVGDLQQQNRAANDSIGRKEEALEALTRTVLSQQTVIATTAHQDLQKTQSFITKNIEQYRNDTSSAVSRIMRPPRTLGDKRQMFIDALKQGGPHDVAISCARGSAEAITYTAEIESAFTEAGWKIVPTRKFAFVTKDGFGLTIVTKEMPGKEVKWADMTPAQAALAKAVVSVGIPLTATGQADGDKEPTELYVGLQ